MVQNTTAPQPPGNVSPQSTQRYVFKSNEGTSTPKKINLNFNRVYSAILFLISLIVVLLWLVGFFEIYRNRDISTSSSGISNSAENSSQSIAKISEKNTSQVLLVDLPEVSTQLDAYGVTFSKDGKKAGYVIYSADENGDRGYNTYINDKVVGPKTRTRSVMFSLDSQRYAYEVESISSYLIIDGNKSKYEGSSIGNYKFSPDSKHFAYTICNLRYDDKVGSFTVMDGKKFNFESSCGAWSVLEFSPDSSKLAFQARDEEGVFMVENGVRQMKFEKTEDDKYPRMSKPFYSPDSKVLAYMVSNDKNGSYLMQNGNKVKRYPEKDALSGNFMVFSPDSKRLAYKLKIGDKYRMVIDFKEGPEFKEISSPVFSPDSKLYAYLADDTSITDPHFLMINEEKITTEADVSMRVLSEFFSPNSKNYAYIEEKEGEMNSLFTRNIESKLVVGKNKFPMQTSIGGSNYYLGFSPDNKTLAYVGNDSSGKQFMVLNNLKSKEYDGIYEYTVSFAEDSKSISYGAREGNKIYWVTDTIPKEVSENNYYKLVY